MRLSLLAAFLIAIMTLPAEAARPVKGAVQGMATAATGIAKGVGEAGVGVVRGSRTAVRGTRQGASLTRRTWKRWNTITATNGARASCNLSSMDLRLWTVR